MDESYAYNNSSYAVIKSSEGKRIVYGRRVGIMITFTSYYIVHLFLKAGGHLMKKKRNTAQRHTRWRKKSKSKQSYYEIKIGSVLESKYHHHRHNIKYMSMYIVRTSHSFAMRDTREYPKYHIKCWKAADI